ncbi:hypothetical protein ACP4OV_018638 [Aristida adscensionis]
MDAATAASSPETRIAPIHDSLPLPPPAQVSTIDVEERLERLERQVSMMQTTIHRFPGHITGGPCLALPQAAQEMVEDMAKTMNKVSQALIKNQISMKSARIHRFPHHLRGIGGPDGRYLKPSVVAIGPYHRHDGQQAAHLEEMEAVKHAVASQFCRDCGRSEKEVYEKIFSVIGDVRGCYTTADGSSLVADLSDADLAAMMFLDGCFLLQLMAKHDEPPIAGRILSSSPSIYKDIFLLENQIPWLVLEALMEFMTKGNGLVSHFIAHQMGLFFTAGRKAETKSTDHPNKPPHLLGLLWLSLTRDIPSQTKKIRGDDVSEQRSRGKFIPTGEVRRSSSAVYLAQVGIKLTASTAAGWFPDMGIKRKKMFFGELSLSPLNLNDIVACYLANLAALEAAAATTASSTKVDDGYVVSSYLSVLAMVMDREDDVHELRGKGLLCSRFSDQRTLTFFKSLSEHLRLGHNYFIILEGINKYMREMSVWIIVHKFVYNNYRVIAAVLSIAGVLVGIFKALYSLKRP